MTKRDTARQARYVGIDDDVEVMRGDGGGDENDDDESDVDGGEADCDGAAVDVVADNGTGTTRLLQRRPVRRKAMVSQTH